MLLNYRERCCHMSFYEKQIASEKIFEGKIFRVTRDKVVLSDGQERPREVVLHHGGVGIVPVTENGDVLMVRQYRYAVGRELLEIPAGKLEKDEDPFEAAVRELSEETGCTAGSWTDLGEMYPTPGYCSETLHIYLATGLRYGEMHLDDGELLSVERIPMDEVLGRIMKNEIRDAKTVFGVMKAKEILSGKQEAYDEQNDTDSGR